MDIFRKALDHRVHGREFKDSFGLTASLVRQSHPKGSGESVVTLDWVNSGGGKSFTNWLIKVNSFSISRVSVLRL